MELLARQFLRALRGKRSQAAFSRRLGFRSKVAAEWESGRRHPTATTVLTACMRVGIDVKAAFERFHAATASLVASEGKQGRPVVSVRSLAAWLSAHRGRMRAVEISKRTNLSATKLSRVFGGSSRVKLADFFRIVEATTGRLTDLVATLVDIEQVPIAALPHRQLEASRALAFAEPWTSAMLVLLDTEAYRRTELETVAFLSRRLGIDAATVSRGISGLVRAGALQRRGGKYRLTRSLTIDTRDAERAALLQRHWARASYERLLSPDAHDLFSYNVFSASRADFTRIRELQKQYFRELRAIISASEPGETAGLLVLHLVHFGDVAE